MRNLALETNQGVQSLATFIVDYSYAMFNTAITNDTSRS